MIGAEITGSVLVIRGSILVSTRAILVLVMQCSEACAARVGDKLILIGVDKSVPSELLRSSPPSQ